MLMDTNIHVRSYLDFLRIERGLSVHTISAYKRDLEKFSAFLDGANTSIEKVKSEDIGAFTAHLRDEGLSQSSINRILSALRSFYKHLNKELDIADPTVDLVWSKLARRLPKALSVSEIASLIDSADRIGEHFATRDHAILELLYSTGARVSEIVGANIGDFATVKSDGSEIQVLKLRGKGGKERIVPLGSYASKAVDTYLVRLRPSLSEKTKRPDSALFLNSRGTRLSRQSAWAIVLKAAQAVGLDGKVSPHVFRHSYATHLLDGGADIRVVQELLGHASVTTTQIYTLVTIDKVRESYSLAHPRAK